MDIITTTTTNITKSPEHEPETPTRIQQPTTTTPKPLSFSNGVLKRHHHHHPYNNLANPGAAAVAAAASVTYKECLKNHAASIGGHALDGCGEFMPAPTATAGDPASIKCAACGCHRNFHRRESDEPPLSPVIEYQPHHRHHPPPPPPPPPFLPPNTNHHHPRSPNSASPPPISSSYYPASAPHMLLALSSGGGLPVPPENTAAPAGTINHPLGSRKRFRTKFTSEQKEKMHRFAERVGWKIQKRDEDLIQAFCHEVGVDRGVLKVWMHNNKNTFGKRDLNASGDGGDANANSNSVTVTVSASANANNFGVVGNRNVLEQIRPENGNNGNGNGEINGDGSSGNDDDSGANGGGTNGSSSSS